MYRCAPQIPRVIEQFARLPGLPADLAVLCIDNQSPDETLAAAEAALAASPVREKYLLRNDDNYGLGGSHKVAIDFAHQHGFEYLVVLHGDDQGSIADLQPHLAAGVHRTVDALLGARFMRGATLQGYSTLRTAANHVFNAIFSIIGGQWFSDLGSGLNLFRTSIFADGFHLKYADNLTFNYYLVFGLADHGHRFRFFPINWREDDQVSNARLFSQGIRMLKLLRQRLLSVARFHAAEHRDVPRASYPATLVRSWPAPVTQEQA
ncbi:dolichyl-phosphate mannose synthase [Croceibacterium mercuriale]|uniref:Dolichyl-phosphate mannose synthase n=2 Tax=Croceibacterium mercuriale TaxID=1572751 RepID=A0A0B2C461_9SPHN|nr:dolichyl-phosphate mannose synthase [Croceibacterium mercuriale]